MVPREHSPFSEPRRRGCGSSLPATLLIGSGKFLTLWADSENLVHQKEHAGGEWPAATKGLWAWHPCLLHRPSTEI